MIASGPNVCRPGFRRVDDDGWYQVADDNRSRPSLVLEPVDRVAFLDDVALRLPVPVAFVVPAEAVLDRLVRRILQLPVERGRHREPVFVQDLRAVLVLEVFADLLDEERGDARRLIRLPARHDRPLLGSVGLRLLDVVLVGHALQHGVAPLRRALHVDEWALPLRCLEDASDERGFLEVQLLVRLLKVQARRRFDAVRPMPQVHLVAVNREDFLLRVALFDLDREDRLADLPVEQLSAWSGRTDRGCGRPAA